MTVIGTIYKTKSGRVFIVKEIVLPKNNGGVYKFYQFDELQDEDNLSYRKEGIRGNGKLKTDILKTIKEIG